MTQAIRYRTNQGVRHGLLVKETQSKVYVILVEENPHVRKLPKTEGRYFSDDFSHKSVNRIKSQIKQHAKRHGAKLSKEAKELLR